MIKLFFGEFLFLKKINFIVSQIISLQGFKFLNRNSNFSWTTNVTLIKSSYLLVEHFVEHEKRTRLFIYIYSYNIYHIILYTHIYNDIFFAAPPFSAYFLEPFVLSLSRLDLEDTRVAKFHYPILKLVCGRTLYTSICVSSSTRDNFTAMSNSIVLTTICFLFCFRVSCCSLCSTTSVNLFRIKIFRLKSL